MQQSVQDGIDEAARDVIEEWGSRHRAGLPLHVWAQVHERRPDICGHLRRYTSGDPCQHVALRTRRVLRRASWITVAEPDSRPGALEDEAE